MKKMALISTYQIDCGIARFAEILFRDLKEYFEIEVINLDPYKLKKSFGASNQTANNFIKKIIDDLQKFDMVNIQFEYGIFADDIHESIARIKKIITSHKHVTITFHTLLSRQTSLPSLHPYGIFKPFDYLKKIIFFSKIKLKLRYERELFNFIKSHNVKIIVQTKSSEKILRENYNISKVYSHPLCYTLKEENDYYNYEYCRSSLLKKYALNKKDFIIGVFGFYGHYKGFDYAIQCIAKLPDNYKLLIFGGLHPAHIQSLDTTESDKLIQLCEHYKVSERVYFIGAVTNDEMYMSIAGVDMCWLPYREVGQEASAICSETAELARRVILSKTFAFMDYYCFGLRKNVKFFDIGNIEELKLKTLMYDNLVNSQLNERCIGMASAQARFYASVLLDNI